jgi:hypothetical protein
MRQWYLYQEIRPLCYGNKDITCPKPTVPKPEITIVEHVVKTMKCNIWYSASFVFELDIVYTIKEHVQMFNIMSLRHQNLQHRHQNTDTFVKFWRKNDPLAENNVSVLCSWDGWTCKCTFDFTFNIQI